MSAETQIQAGDIVRLKAYPIRGKSYAVKQIVGGICIVEHDGNLTTLRASDLFIVKPSIQKP